LSPAFVQELIIFWHQVGHEGKFPQSQRAGEGQRDHGLIKISVLCCSRESPGLFTTPAISPRSPHTASAASGWRHPASSSRSSAWTPFPPQGRKSRSRDAPCRWPFSSPWSSRTGTPVRNTVVVGTGVALLAAFVPLGALTDLTSLGTLVAFTVVSAGVIILRRAQPDLSRGFKVPGYPITPLLSIAFCLYLIYGLHMATFAMFAAWLAGAAALYFGYGIKHSRLTHRPSQPLSETLPWQSSQ
jgi:hypothetical protein